MKRASLLVCSYLLLWQSHAQTVTLSAGELESVTKALSGHEVFRRNYEGDRAVGYERCDSKLVAAPRLQQALSGFTLLDVQQRGDFLLLYGSDRLYVRNQETQHVAGNRKSSAALIAIYLPGFADPGVLAQRLSDEVFFPDITTAIVNVPDSLKACVPQAYSPTTKNIVPVARCTSRPSEPTILPPTLIKQVDPQIPQEMRGKAGHWDVLVSLVVDGKGLPTGVHIMRPSYAVPPLNDWKQLSESAGTALDESAVAAVNKYRFKPAIKDGAAVPYQLFVDVDYKVF